MKHSPNTGEKCKCRNTKSPIATIRFWNANCPIHTESEVIKTKPSQQECFCDCHEGEKIWGKEHSSVESCCNCQPPKSSEWEKKIDKYIKGRHYTSRVYGDNEFNKVIAVSLKRRALQDIKLIMRQALYQQQKEVEERVRRETIDKSFDWIWDGWNLNLANKDRAKEQFLTSIEEKGGRG